MIDTRLRGLYAVTDERLIPAHTFAASVELALKGGARLLQYRDKSDDTGKRVRQAGTLRDLCTDYGALFIINDDIELAQRVNADGAHLGQHDANIAEARRVLGKHAIIGVSCYNELERALAAQQAGANYIAFGSFFSSPTKPAARRAGTDLIIQAKQQLSLPVCAIGGIDLNNAAELVAHNVDMIAVISGLFAHNDITARARALSDLF